MNAKPKALPFAQLRPMQMHDLEQVAAIEQSAYSHPWTEGIFHDCLKAGYNCWSLEQAGELIGYGILSVAADEAHVLNVCVRPDAQGEGHGKRLLKRLIDLARWHRAERIFLEVRPSNPAAIGLYHKLGFVEVGRRRDYYPATQGREDALVLALQLVAEKPV